MKKVVEYRALLSGWKIIREIPMEATDADWLAWAGRNYSTVRVRTIRKEVAE